MKGKLSNEITTAEVQFEVIFIPKKDPYYYINDQFVPAFLKTFKNNELSTWEVMPGRRLYYELPAVNDPDKVKFSLGHSPNGS